VGEVRGTRTLRNGRSMPTSHEGGDIGAGGMGISQHEPGLAWPPQPRPLPEHRNGRRASTSLLATESHSCSPFHPGSLVQHQMSKSQAFSPSLARSPPSSLVRGSVAIGGHLTRSAQRSPSLLERCACARRPSTYAHYHTSGGTGSHIGRVR
jgi:hypothetical protein